MVPGPMDRPGRPGGPELPNADDRRRTAGEEAQLRPTSPRPDLRALGDRSDATDRLDVTDHPARWSKADLRQRLERLPPGHPSSLRSDDQDSDEAKLDHQADAPKRNYWSEVPRFLRDWANHVRRWPAERVAAVVDRSRDPAGSWRGDGQQYLDPERNTQANDLIAGVGRSEKKLTASVREAEHENVCGGWLEGLEHRLKGEGRLKEKIAEKLEHEPAKTPAEVARQISDAIRYTFCFESTSYSDGYWDIKQRLEVRECQMIYSKNRWRDDPEYKGINTRWVTPEGQRFEVQFHTPESYHAKQELTHGSYERLRNPLTRDDERQELRSYQREVCRWIEVPEGAAGIADYLWRGHN